ncbi:uncharacterized protein APUU_11795S [Aspergillus puulaauensis]|uniref:Uncharacterized protein n=1 Tax=Aspergillus puulaauensis TaxID=1220207 RepID=A0A7R7XCL9_9EURO|nr:uncharacterized protein APUU_11795S [Aspergillus puulaauensis]BCS18967.1 hypothetical protein APUU_11795S [Aspergillus puulaauensis]
MMLLLFIYIVSLLSVASANVEKTIFIAPSAVTLPAKDSTFDDLGLERLSPSNGMLRTQLNASFPIDSKSQGTDSWYFLENLNPGQRYEVRICWLATQPTEFTLSAYTLPEIIEDRALLSAISLYSSSQLATSPPQAATTPIRRGRRSAVADSEPSADSVLFLRISAAADYFSLDQTLMENVPPVLADVILDPFLGNVFPKSLAPTACWISVVACLGIVVARWISREFTRVVNSADIRDPQDVKKDQ